MALMASASQDRAESAVRFLFSLQGFGVKLGLRNMRGFLNELGDPHKTLPAVHLAGSNGKGSTASFIASILTEAGFRTALYTSPHLVDFRERIRIGGNKIPHSYVAMWIERNKSRIVRRKITFFEATTALAFDWFRSRQVDIAVIETGLGGRLDATNVLDPLCTAITSISLEHTNILGTTQRAIAGEKAGIARNGVPCVVGEMDGATRKYLVRTLGREGVPVFCSSAGSVRASARQNGHLYVDMRTERGTMRGMKAGLPGVHQVRNLRTAYSVVQVLRQAYGLKIPDAAIRRGIGRVVANTGLEGRAMSVKGHANLFADVAHNPSAIRMTTRHFLRRFGSRSMRLVFGIASDKDVRTVLRCLRPLAAELIVVKAKTHRGLDTETIMKICRGLRIPARPASSVAMGVREAIRPGSRGPVLVTGSHFVVGEALASLRHTKYLTISQ